MMGTSDRNGAIATRNPCQNPPRSVVVITNIISGPGLKPAERPRVRPRRREGMGGESRVVEWRVMNDEWGAEMTMSGG